MIPFKKISATEISAKTQQTFLVSLAPRTPAMPGMIVMCPVHSRDAYEKLLFPVGWRSLPKQTRTMGQLTQTST